MLGNLADGRLPERYLILETSADLRRVQREWIEQSAPAWSEGTRE